MTPRAMAHLLVRETVPAFVSPACDLLQTSLQRVKLELGGLSPRDHNSVERDRLKVFAHLMRGQPQANELIP
jgi:hypothetical protein